LGAAEDKDAFNLLLDAAVTDKDLRVRVSAIRSLGNLKDAKAADKLLERGENLLANYKKSKFTNPIEKNELLEIATALGKLLLNSNNERKVKFLIDFMKSDGKSPEIYISLAGINPDAYLAEKDFHLYQDNKFDWQIGVAYVQGLGELANANDLIREIAEKTLRAYATEEDFNGKKIIEYDLTKTIPDALRSYASFKAKDLTKVLQQSLKHKDAIVRATAAELLGEQATTKENVEALKTAFAQALQHDKDYNDAQLAILSALVKLDKTEAVSSLKLALDAPDFLVRRHAAELIKQNDLQKDFPNASEKVGTVKPYNPKTGTKLGQILNTNADYVRAVSRKSARAIITTEKGTFTIKFAPEDAPLTVDNFIKLAKSGYFNNVAIHRVVPNFVAQDGDPRGDGNGGPGWEIRDEINMIPYERGAVGMALSGKDTGGSQWFVTHSPQPHLDGGYTVFGKVNETGMKVVDNLVRGDKILSVRIVEGNLLHGTQRK
jgi:cyclophilin family peptidyl-prolyl cis-trans isomerase/HEAT repeat protein